MLTIDSIVSNAYREENTMNKITIRNAFGKEYTVDAKTRDEIEKFTSADVFVDDENDTLIDEGYFTENGFHSTTLIESDKNKDCECKTRTQHITHLQEILESEDVE